MTEKTSPITSDTRERPSSFAFYLLVSWFIITIFWWVLAFAPLPSAPPDWLLKGRAACFGILENGLPDTYGWMRLIVSPTAILIILLVIWWDSLRQYLAYLISRRSGLIFLAVLLMAPLASGIWVTQLTMKGLRITAKLESPPPEIPFPENYNPTSSPVHDFQFTDQKGRTVSLKALQGRLVFLTFGFGHCEVYCPLVIQRVMQGAEKMKEEQPAIVIITLDPWRDKLFNIQDIAKKWKFTENVSFVTGPVDEINQILDSYEVSRERNELTGNIIHPAMVYIISPSGEITYTLNNPSIKWIVEAGRRTLEQSPPPAL